MAAQRTGFAGVARENRAQAKSDRWIEAKWGVVASARYRRDVSSDNPTDPTTVPGPAPQDNEGFDAWARAGHDNWQRAAVMDAARSRWEDAKRPVPERLLAGIWGSRAGAPPALDLLELLAEPDLDPDLVARAHVAVALDLAGFQSEDSISHAERALALANDQIPIRSRVSVWLDVAQAYARAGRVPDALKVLADAAEAVAAADDVPAWAQAVVDAERLAMMAPAVRDRKQFAIAVDKVAAVATALPPTPPAIEVVAKMAALLSALGVINRAETYAEHVVSATAPIPQAAGMAFEAQMVLADCQERTEGPEAALAARRAAIATIEPLGASPGLGWAMRTVGVSLKTLDRHDEAAEALGAAADIYLSMGARVEGLVLRLEQSESLVEADQLDQARDLVKSVQNGLEDLPATERPRVEYQMYRVMAHIAATDGDLDTAAEHWLEVADLSPKVGRPDLEARLTAAQLYATDGDFDESEAQFLRAELTAAEAPEPARVIATVMRVRAETLRDTGRPEEAAEAARLAANHARTSGDEPQAIVMEAIAADSVHAAGDSAAAVQLYENLLVAAAEAKQPELAGAIHFGLAKVLKELGRTEEAMAHEAEARELLPKTPPKL